MTIEIIITLSNPELDRKNSGKYENTINCIGKKYNAIRSRAVDRSVTRRRIKNKIEKRDIHFHNFFSKVCMLNL